MTRVRGLALVLTLGSPLWGASAFADQMHPSMQFVCLPRLVHFSATTLALDNIDPAKIQRGKQLYVAELYDLADHPFRRAWLGGTISVKATYVHDQQPRGFCGGVEWANLEIDWNGKPLATIEQSNCGDDWHSVDLDGLDGPNSRTFLIRHCHRASETDNDQNKSGCEEAFFDIDKGALRK